MSRPEGFVERYRRGELRIKAAAIRTLEGKLYWLPRPARHGDVMRHIREEAEPGWRMRRGDEQGFVTECGEFLNRSQALAVATTSGQLKGQLIGNVLTSEDLW